MQVSQSATRETDKCTITNGSKQIAISINHSIHRVIACGMQPQNLTIDARSYNGIATSAPLSINANMSKEEVLTALRTAFAGCQITVQ